jgi:hypothetical protein
MMRLLAQRVPLTLILDLVIPPNARELYEREGVSPDWGLWSGIAVPYPVSAND